MSNRKLLHFLRLVLLVSPVAANEEICALSINKRSPSSSSYQHLAQGLEAQEDEDCDAEFGLGRLKKYQLDGQNFCSADSPNVSFSCTASWIEKSSTVAKADDYICRGKGLKLLLPPKNGKQSVEVYGSGAGGCQWTLPPDGLQLQYFVFSTDTVDIILHSGEVAAAQVCEDTGSSPLILFTDADWWNPYINQAQSLMAYVSIVALDLDPRSLRLIRMPRGRNSAGPKAKDGPMKGLHSWLFSQGGPAIELQDQQQLICTDNLIVPTGGHRNLFRKSTATDEDPRALTCRNSPLMRGFGAFIKDSFISNNEGPSTETPASSTPLETVRVTLISRHRSSAHPYSFHRELTNSQEVVAKLKNDEANELSALQVSASTEQKQRLEQLASERAASQQLAAALRKSGANVSELQLELLPVSEQVKAMAETDILISPHSAALSWMLVMPPCAQVLEICANELRQFVNYARLVDVEHQCVGPLISWGDWQFSASADDLLQQTLAAKKRRDQCLRSSDAKALP